MDIFDISVCFSGAQKCLGGLAEAPKLLSKETMTIFNAAGLNFDFHIYKTSIRHNTQFHCDEYKQRQNLENSEITASPNHDIARICFNVKIRVV